MWVSLLTDTADGIIQIGASNTHMRTHSLSLLHVRQDLWLCVRLSTVQFLLDTLVCGYCWKLHKKQNKQIVWDCLFRIFWASCAQTSSSNLFSLSSAPSVRRLIFLSSSLAPPPPSYKPGPVKGFFPLKGSLSGHCHLLGVRLWVAIKHQETLWQTLYKLLY